ncbi:MAG: VWD domain-containing protein [Roseinatronobacter sp.]
MAVVKTGIFFENASTYTYGFSDASGQLLVSNGQTLTLTSATAGPFVSAGSPGSGAPDPDALGEITLRDQGSLLQVVSGPASPDGTGLSIGYGARGLMQVLGGAEFRLSNPTGANNAEVSIGVGGGTGTALVDASGITIQSTMGEVALMIGDWAGAGADGTLSLRNGATALFEGGEGAFANVGRLAGNEGAILVQSGSALELRAPDGRQANLRVGRNEGTGQLQVTDENSLVQLSGQLAIGLDGGLGTVQIANGGAVVNAHHASVATRIGQGTTAQGAATVDGGSLITRSEAGFAQLDIGVAGGEGTLQGTASALTVQGMQGVDIAIGEGAGADGRMRLENGSTAQFSSGTGGVNLDVGRFDASGLLEVIGSQLTIHAPRDGGTDSYAFVLVGSQGGEGQLILDAAQLSVEGQSAGVHVGTRWSGSDANDGTGDVILRNGSEMHVQAGDVTGGFWVGGGDGSQGRAQILSGSVLDMGGNGLVQIGFAAPNMTGGGTGHVTIDGAGSHATGLRGLDLGRGGSDGVLDVSNDARALFGGLGAGRNVNLDIGWDTGSEGVLNITDALVSVQAGTAQDEPFEFKGVTANFGRQGGTGLANISGAGHDEGAALQGLVLLGHAESDYVDITFGQGVGSAGHAVVRGAVLGARNDGITFGPEGEINLGGNGGYAAMRIGLQGGAGSVDLGESSTLFVMSGGIDDAAEIVVGSGAGATGSLHLSGGSELDLIARQQDAWLVAGGEGGASGTITMSASSAFIEAARNGGVRLGTSWFDTPDRVGIGRLTLEEGSDLTISAQGSGANFFVGGGAGSDAQAIIRDSSVSMDGAAHRLVIVGGTPAFTPGTGGAGEMHLQGATARLLGARDILVGTNGGDGRLELRAGAQAILEDAGGGSAGQTVAGIGIGRVREGQADIAATGALVVDGAGSLLAGEAAGVSRLIVGASGGTAAAQISGGASVQINAGVSAVEIGVDGGIGRMDVTGAGTRVAVEGADGRIHIGRGLNPQASAEGAGQGILTIGAGADVLASTKVELGDAGAATSVLALAGGRLTTPLIEVYSGPVPQNNMLLGYGEIVGTAGQPALVMSGSSFYVGDQIGADGGQITATGVMAITGNVVKQGSAVHFDIGSAGGGYDQVLVTGAFAMNGGSLHLSMLEAAQNVLAGNGVRLLSASEGIFLNDVALVIDPLPDGTVIGTELRAGDTELWAVWEGGPAAFVPLPAAWQSWLDWIGGGGGAPPAAPQVARADTIADPHLVTLDGLAYDFHAAGEFVLTRSTDGSFEVQARMAPVGENASENVAAAVRLEGGTVMVDATTPDSVLINGNAVTLTSGQSIAVGGRSCLPHRQHMASGPPSWCPRG